MSVSLLTNLIAPIVAAGVVIKVTDSMFGSNQLTTTRRPTKRTRRYARKRVNHPGNFSNLGIGF